MEENDKNLVEHQEDKKVNKYKGVRGWLALFSGGVIISVIYAFLSMFTDVSAVLKPDYENVRTTILLVSLPVSLLLVVLGIVYILKTIKNRKSAKTIALIILTVYPILYLISSIVVVNVLENDGFNMYDYSWAPVFRNFFVALIWIPYFLVSKRVKQTFVK